jgi:hypothetical protein
MGVGTGILRSGRVALILGLLAALSVAALVLPGHASAQLTWSTPAQVDTTGGASINAIACPTESDCTAIDEDGKIINFDPSSPSNPHVVPVAPGQSPDAISCPSATECVAAGFNEVALIFDPTTVAPAKTLSVGTSGASVEAISCPSTTECVAVEDGGRAVVFDPTLSRSGRSLLADRAKLRVTLHVTATVAKRVQRVKTTTITFKQPTPKHRR